MNDAAFALKTRRWKKNIGRGGEEAYLPPVGSKNDLIDMVNRIIKSNMHRLFSASHYRTGVDTLFTHNSTYFSTFFFWEWSATQSLHISICPDCPTGFQLFGRKGRQIPKKALAIREKSLHLQKFNYFGGILDFCVGWGCVWQRNLPGGHSGISPSPNVYWSISECLLNLTKKKKLRKFKR